MAIKEAFNTAMAEHLQTLKQYVPVVARVHGTAHPDFHEVHKLFDAINRKMSQSGYRRPELNEEFTRLREITKNYAVPGDVCESYEAVYKMLEEMDKEYHGEAEMN